MPARLYTSADVERAGRKRLGVKVEPAVRPRKPTAASDEPSAAQLIADAKETLARTKGTARRLADIPQWSEQASDMAETDQPSAFDSPTRKLLRLGKRVARPIPQAAEKAAMVGAFLAPQVAIPSQAIIAAMSGKRLLGGEDEGALATGLDVAGLVGGGGAALKGLRSVIGARQATSAASSAKATKAGGAAQNRYLARQLEGTGYAPGAVEKITGLGPKDPRTIVKGVKPISTQGVDVSGLMDEAWPGRYAARSQGGTKPAGGAYQGLLDVLENPRVTNASGESMASAEALNRMASMQKLGKQYVVYDRTGGLRRLTGPEAVDYRVRPGERYGVMGPKGFELLDRGEAAPRPSRARKVG